MRTGMGETQKNGIVGRKNFVDAEERGLFFNI
jgi:hypothetical protein